MAELLSLGPITTLTQNIVYTAPAKRALIFSNVALQVANDTSFTVPAAVTAATSTELAGGFVRSTTGTAIVRLVGF